MLNQPEQAFTHSRKMIYQPPFLPVSSWRWETLRDAIAYRHNAYRFPFKRHRISQHWPIAATRSSNRRSRRVDEVAENHLHTIIKGVGDNLVPLFVRVNLGTHKPPSQREKSQGKKKEKQAALPIEQQQQHDEYLVSQMPGAHSVVNVYKVDIAAQALERWHDAGFKALAQDSNTSHGEENMSSTSTEKREEKPDRNQANHYYLIELRYAILVRPLVSEGRYRATDDVDIRTPCEDVLQ